MSSNKDDLCLINIAEAAEFLKMKISRLRNMVFRKELPFFKIGASVRFNKADLLDWLRSKKQEVGHE